MKMNVGYLNEQGKLFLAYLLPDFSTSVSSDGASEREQMVEWTLDDLLEQKTDILIYSSNEAILKNQELSEKLFQFETKLPLIADHQTGLEIQDLTANRYDELRPKLVSLKEKWVLKNNLQLLDEFFPTLNHFKEQLENDRQLFFEELFYLLKSNLGASSIKIIYKDLEANLNDTPQGEEAQESHESTSESSEDESDQVKLQPRQRKKRGKLINMSTSGDYKPTTSKGGEIEQKLMTIYTPLCYAPFMISEYSAQKGECLILVNIKGAPCIIMTTFWSLSTFTSALLKSFFTGLNN